MKYPKSVFFILASAFCDSFANIGLRTILPLYFVDILMCDENMATIMFHAFILLCYLNSVIISLFADSKLGKYRLLLYIGVIYTIGQLLLSMTSISVIGLPAWEFSILSIYIITLGPGTIFTCIMPFGGDQFKLPHQQSQCNSFFSFIYFFMSASGLVATFILPMLRKDITCFGLNSCYPLSFFTLSFFVFLYTVIFFSGRNFYIIKKSDCIIPVKVVKCIYHAIFQKITGDGTKREHWLDYADDKYDQLFINDVKSVLKLLKLYIPLPIYWTVFRQQSSRWTFQAARMDGEIFGYLIKPDQFHVVHPILMILSIPSFQFFIYPLIEKFLFINTTLKKMTIGGLLASLAFVVSGIIELKIEPTYAVQPSAGLAQVRIFNAIDCNATLRLNEYEYPLEALNIYQSTQVSVNNTENWNVTIEYINCAYTITPNYLVTAVIEVREAQATSWILTKDGISSGFYDKIDKSRSGDPKVRALINLDSWVYSNSTLKLESDKNLYTIELTKDTQSLSKFTEVLHDSYKVILDGQVIAEKFSLKFGGVYTIIGHISDTKKMINFVTLVEPNSIHMLWQLPQYCLICVSEMMFIVNAMEFAYSEGPANMKSFLYAAISLASACGDLIVIVLARAQLFERQVIAFFFYALLLFVDMIIFATMAKFYKYVKVSSTGS